LRGRKIHPKKATIPLRWNQRVDSPRLSNAANGWFAAFNGAWAQPCEIPNPETPKTAPFEKTKAKGCGTQNRLTHQSAGHPPYTCHDREAKMEIPVNGERS
jgi:hypothetical protein